MVVRLLSALTAVPAFLEPGVPAVPMILAGIAITVTVVGVVLVFAGLRRPPAGRCAMTATAQVAARPAPASSRTSGTRRMGMALAMIIAPWGFVVTNTAYALAIRDGGNEATSLDALALYAAHPDLVRIAVVAGMLGCLLLVPAVLGVFRLAPSTSRLVLAGGSLMIAGYIAYFAVLNSSLTTLAMAEHGEPVETFAAVLDASQAEPWGGVLFLTFVVGNLIGTALLAVGLLVSRAVPVWAAVGILAWPPLHVDRSGLLRQRGAAGDRRGAAGDRFRRLCGDAAATAAVVG